MRRETILWILLLALALTACGQGGEVLPEEPAREPEIEAPERREETQRRPQRIMSEEALEYTNRSGWRMERPFWSSLVRRYRTSPCGLTRI